jgi:hypothetical protein
MRAAEGAKGVDKLMMLRVFIAALAVTVSGCSGLIDELPTTPDPVITTETFTGTLNVNGGRTHPVFLAATGNVVATLTSLGDAPPSNVGFSMGTLSLTGACNTVLSNDAAAVNTVLSGTVSTLSGSLCVRIYDNGNLTGPVDYAFTVSHP